MVLIPAVGLGARTGFHCLHLLFILNPLPAAINSLGLMHTLSGWGCCVCHPHLKFHKGVPRGAHLGHLSLLHIRPYPYSVNSSPIPATDWHHFLFTR